MDSVANNPSPVISESRVLVICLDHDEAKVRAIIKQNALVDWEQRAQICLLVVQERWRFTSDHRVENYRGLKEKLNRLAPPAAAARIISVGQIPLHEFLGSRGDSRAPTYVRNPDDLSNQLPGILKQSGLYWLIQCEAELKHYHFSHTSDQKLDSDRINRWLSQFTRAKVGWIGEALLKLVDFWPTHKLCEHLCHIPGNNTPSDQKATEAWFNCYEHFAFGSSSGGASSLLVNRLITKGFGDAEDNKRIENLSNFLEESKSSTRLLFLEDCLMTGTEIIKLLRSISTEQILKHEIDLKFAFATEAGLQRLQVYLKRRNITSIKIHAPLGGFLPNLTQEGLLAANDGTLLRVDESHEFAAPLLHIIDGITLRTNNYYGNAERKKIIKFCRAIGEPLMKLHFRNKGWSDEKTKAVTTECTLGISNLGLLIAFAHGISKPVVPLFWAGGEINVELPFSRGARFVGNWEPLFPTRR